MTEQVPVPEADSTPHPTLTDSEPAAHPVGGVVSLPSGLTMPKLGFGTWQLEGDTAANAVEHALRNGWRHIDTAQMYGNEAEVGRGIVESGVDPDEIFVTTKIDNADHDPEALTRSMDRSLEKLGLDRVDLTLIHWPVEWDRMGATLAALAQVHASGITRHIGVSNFTADQLDQAKDMAPIEVLQVECHPFLRQHQLRAWCVEHDWAFTAYSPLAQGAVFERDELSAMARRHGANEAQIALAWLIAQDNVVAIPRSSSPDHIDLNLGASDIVLTEDDLALFETFPNDHRIVDPDIAPW